MYGLVGTMLCLNSHHASPGERKDPRDRLPSSRVIFGGIAHGALPAKRSERRMSGKACHSIMPNNDTSRGSVADRASLGGRGAPITLPTSDAATSCPFTREASHKNGGQPGQTHHDPLGDRAPNRGSAPSRERRCVAFICENGHSSVPMNDNTRFFESASDKNFRNPTS